MADGWKRGLPPGKYYPGMADDYDVYFSPAGLRWHRKRPDAEKARIDDLHRLKAEFERSKHVKQHPDRT